MDEELGSASVREQLITAGIAELEAHGIADFSLRRGANYCNISCAAPYKHFKSKEALIESIFDGGNLHCLYPLLHSESAFSCGFDAFRKKPSFGKKNCGQHEKMLPGYGCYRKSGQRICDPQHRLWFGAFA